MNELVSIIMPSYKTAAFIKESILSILQQTYPNFEILIVDDASIDGTKEIVESIDDARIRYLENKKNYGAAYSRNLALRHAKGTWVAFLDSDDIWYPQKLEKQLNFMKENNYVFSYTNYEEIDEAGNELGVIVTGPRKISKRKMYQYCWPGCLTIMYNKDKIGIIQVHPNIKKNNDYAMWLQVAEKSDCYLLDCVLAKYRKRQGSISNHNYLGLIKWHYYLFYQQGFSKKEACYNTLRNLVFGAYKKCKYVKRVSFKAGKKGQIGKKKQIIGICGHFGFGEELVNGQTIKTKIFTEELEKKVGKEKIRKLDSSHAKENLLLFIKKCKELLITCDMVIMFPANRGLLVLTPVFYLLNKKYKKQLYYVVIGGWLVGFLRKHKIIRRYLKGFQGIFVETATMKNKLEKEAFYNVQVVPNIKRLNNITEKEIKKDFGEPYKVCIFSRIEEKKGIEDAIWAVKQINKKYGKILFILDIYGPVQENYIEKFEKEKERFPGYIYYCGVVPEDKTVEVLKEYYLLLFPTKYYTEGVPGTIIDAYSAGVPVISSMWENFDDVVLEGKTGYGYQFADKQDMARVIERVYLGKERLMEIRRNCLLKSKEYTPEVVIKDFMEKIGVQ